MPSSKVKEVLDRQLKSSVEETFHSRSLREIRRLNNSIWMPAQKPSNQFHTRTNLGTSRTQVTPSTCKSGRQMEDGIKCSDTVVML
jgi:hypothetical protein